MEMTASTPRGSAAKRRPRLAPALAISLLTGLSACVSGHVPAPQASLPPPVQVQPPPAPAPVPELVNAGPEMFGTASWYRPGPGLRRTCTGETFTRDEMTAASHSIPLGTRVRVALLDDSRSIIVRADDCMPRGHRLLDLSEGAAEQLGVVNMGVAHVTVTPVMLVDNR
jgi:rare lipoprotein A